MRQALRIDRLKGQGGIKFYFLLFFIQSTKNLGVVATLLVLRTFLFVKIIQNQTKLIET